MHAKKDFQAVITNLIGLSKLAKEKYKYNGAAVEEISTENVSTPKKNLINDPKATREELEKELDRIREENVNLESENIQTKITLSNLKKELRGEKQKLVDQKIELEKKNFLSNRRNTVNEYEHKKMMLEQKYKNQLEVLKSDLKKSLKKFENLETVYDTNSNKFRSLSNKVHKISRSTRKMVSHDVVDPTSRRSRFYSEDEAFESKNSFVHLLPPFLRNELVLNELKLTLSRILFNQDSNFVESLSLKEFFHRNKKTVKKKKIKKKKILKKILK